MPQRVTEKPGGTRGVSTWSARIQRAYNPLWAFTGHKEPVFFDADTCARLVIEIDFYDSDAAAEFQSKIIAMMPGAE